VVVFKRKLTSYDKNESLKEIWKFLQKNNIYLKIHISLDEDCREFRLNICYNDDEGSGENANPENRSDNIDIKEDFKCLKKNLEDFYYEKGKDNKDLGHSITKKFKINKEEDYDNFIKFAQELLAHLKGYYS
ncbi:MAG: hypothetical protein IKO42_00315, partial [Opitutales bacterium]|nr:hypothetical protein [Opitutales bacterium]